jgi:hypothetical protein
MRRRRVLVLTGLIATVALLVILPSSYGAIPPPEGGAIASCSNSGYIPEWIPEAHVTIGPCLSYYTAFYGWKQNASQNCFFNGYRAFVFWIRNDGAWINRWDRYYCLNGTWYETSRWGYSERRLSQMDVLGGSNWAMVQYRPN